MGTSTILKWITGGLEAFLGIPILGGAIVIGFGWTPLLVMLILHIVTLIFSVKEFQNKYGSIMGIITSVLAWIPVVGMILHIITGLLLLIDAYRSKTHQYR
jgi:hypothetical protein